MVVMKDPILASLWIWPLISQNSKPSSSKSFQCLRFPETGNGQFQKLSFHSFHHGQFDCQGPIFTCLQQLRSGAALCTLSDPQATGGTCLGQNCWRQVA